ncbi:unnamed protein product [Phytophthora lilii]|uniref:Unnamed protein product n=1 Tax=Phytophthora lilii TaxID=2077276 RepID=A0A9W6U516_9STRA|nr:unnamed protein product [Phytophthora lilii]
MLDDMWASSCTRIEDRAPWWSLTNYLRSDPHFYRWEFSNSLDVAIHRGDVAVIQWLLAHGAGSARTPTSALIMKAAKGGHLRVLQALWEHRFSNQHNDRCDSTIDDDSVVKQWCSGGFCNAEHCKDIAIKEAVQNGEFTLCLNDGIHFGQDDLQIATKHALNLGDFELAERLLPLGHCILDFADDCHHPDIILEMFERDHFRWNEGRAATAMSDLAKSGHLQLMQQLFQLHSPLQKNHYGWERAWCDALGSACSSETCLSWPPGNAEVSPQFLTLKKGEAAELQRRQSGRNFVLDPRGMLCCAAEGGDVAVLEWIQATYPAAKCEVAAMDIAAAKGHLAAVQWLHVNRTEGCSKRAMISAATNGHFRMIKWLYESLPDSRTDEDIAPAIRRGHLRIANWLVARFPGCVRKC